MLFNSYHRNVNMFFFLAKIEGLPYKDIAALLDISVKTINNHIAFALEEIAKKLNIRF